MTSVDFRTSGFDGAYPRRVGDYDHAFSQADTAAYATDAAVNGGAGLPGRISRVVNYVAAITSVGLLVGLGVWGVKLVTRDVSGVPVIRAMVGESRVAPDDPGGELSAHIGLAVNAVPAGMAAGIGNDQVAIAPDSTALAAEDLAMGNFGAIATEPGALSDSAPAADPLDPVIAMQDSDIAARQAEADKAAAEVAALAAQAEREAVSAIIADAPAADAAVNEAVTGMDGAEADAAAISAALAEANAFGQAPAPSAAPTPPGALAVSARPSARPARRAPASAPAASQQAAIVPPSKPAANTAPEPAPAAQASTGGNAAVVQIGAFDSEAIASSEWDRIAGKSGGLFAGKSRIIQKHESNGRTFYRLRAAGFASSSSAQEFCSALKSSGTDCLAMKVN